MLFILLDWLLGLVELALNERTPVKINCFHSEDVSALSYNLTRNSALQRGRMNLLEKLVWNFFYTEASTCKTPQNSKRKHNQKYLGYEEIPGHVCMKEPFPPRTHDTNTDVRFVMFLMLDVVSIPAILCSVLLLCSHSLLHHGKFRACPNRQWTCSCASTLTCCQMIQNALEQISRIHRKCSPCFIWLRMWPSTKISEMLNHYQLHEAWLIIWGKGKQPSNRKEWPEEERVNSLL